MYLDSLFSYIFVLSFVSSESSKYNAHLWAFPFSLPSIISLILFDSFHSHYKINMILEHGLCSKYFYCNISPFFFLSNLKLFFMAKQLKLTGGIARI